MMKNIHFRCLRASALLFGLVLVIASTGCVGAVSHLLYVIKGTDVEPPYTGLQESTVAVVCVSDASAYGPDMLTNTIAQAVAMKIQQSGKEINVIPARTVSDWIDRNGWDEADFLKLGNGVGADKIVAIELAAYSIHEGSTLYKGRADLSITVYDLQNNGAIDHMYGPTQYSFPKNGRPAIQSSDRQFEAFFLANMTEFISQQFCPYDRVDQVARDAMSMD